MIIDEFYNWYLTLIPPNNCELEIQKINFGENILDSILKRTIVIDITNDKYIGKFVVWDDNSCFFEIIEILSEKNVLHQRKDFNNLEELKILYKNIEKYF
ncbi:immunity protein TriTu family protein [Gilliamella sp. Choc6-1]|jgi:hypothetical protein|uniref:immunity protein TriTu family protein n=1 Tax=Gilliamella sp. Choc6-1 TaxID=3120239 RepID=UPI0009BD7830|nr:hypothetical protein [Gilliamella apicola]